MPQLEQTEPVPQTIDREAIESIKLLVDVLRIDEQHWTQIVCGVLLAYVERKNGLPEWWVWTRFAATFGTKPTGGYDTWAASDLLDEMLGCLNALEHYRRSNWWQRWRARKVQRTVYRKLLRLGVILNANASRWWDRHDFVKYQKQARG